MILIDRVVESGGAADVGNPSLVEQSRWFFLVIFFFNVRGLFCVGLGHHLMKFVEESVVAFVGSLVGRDQVPFS